VIDPGSVRKATADDAGAIGRIRVDSWRATYAGIVPAHLLDGMEASAFAERLAPRLGALDHGIFVTTTRAGVIRGFAIAASCRDEDAAGEGEVQAIYLAPEARGQGVGGPLLEAACAWLADQGLETVVLWVLIANAPAQRFYERLGFVPDGAARMLDFDGTPIEEIRYRRSIARVPVPST
jgi:ribosomal protein S18 acetylase RimI-like enzyme